MLTRIEQQIERFAPGFRDRVLARAVMDPAEIERHNANLVGGDELAHIMQSSGSARRQGQRGKCAMNSRGIQ